MPSPIGTSRPVVWDLGADSRVTMIETRGDVT